MARPLRRCHSVLLPVLAALSLAACDSPSPAFTRLPATRIELAGAVWSVRATRARAEAIRVSRGNSRTRGESVYLGARAIVLATGCPVVPSTLEGDEAIVRADLSCPASGPRPLPPARPLVLDCEGLDRGRPADETPLVCLQRP